MTFAARFARWITPPFRKIDNAEAVTLSSSSVATFVVASASLTAVLWTFDEDNTNYHMGDTSDSIICHKSSLEAATSSPQTLDPQQSRPRLIFLGTGSSTGCPKPICAMDMFRDSEKCNIKDTALCTVSNLAIQGDPKTNKDYRNNPSLLIQYYDADTQCYKNIVVDVGKTFRETALRWFPKYGIASLDAIILTHHHMDAAGGLDDVRGFQSIRWVVDDKEKHRIGSSPAVDPFSPKGRAMRDPLPLYLSDFCRLNLQSQFPWLLPRPDLIMPKQANDRPDVQRDVASFKVTVFEDLQNVMIQFGNAANDSNDNKNSFRIIPLPVWHGDDLISHGFAFTLQSNDNQHNPLHVVYISDISKMVPETLQFITTQLPPTDVLVVDALSMSENHPVHFSLEQAVELAEHIQPKLQTYLVGMSCDAFLPHAQMNSYLRKKYQGTITMAHDGLVVELPSKSDQEIKRESLHHVVETKQASCSP